MLGINPSARTTCSKPSGNASVILKTPSGISGEQKDVSGNILVSVAKYPEYRYGDRLNITGELLTPKEFDGF